MRKLLLSLVLIASSVQAQQVTSGSGAVLRALDKTSGLTTEIEVGRGQAFELGRLQVALNDCRYRRNVRLALQSLMGSCRNGVIMTNHAASQFIDCLIQILTGWQQGFSKRDIKMNRPLQRLL